MECNVLNIPLLTKQFLCGTPINKLPTSTLSKEECSKINVAMQKEILDNTVKNVLVKQYPIKLSYQRAFLKSLIYKLEESENEVHDDVYDIYCILMQAIAWEPIPESMHYRHFLIDKSTLNHITLCESTSIITGGTTGLSTWQGALSLSQWATQNKAKFHGKTIVELGCGTGLSGLIITTTCLPKKYIFSDGFESILKLTCENIQLNLPPNKLHVEVDHIRRPDENLKLQGRYQDTIVKVIKLNWTEIDEYIKEGGDLPDVIIGADILYDSASFVALVGGLKLLLQANVSYAIIVATVRNIDTYSEFLHELGSQQLLSEEYLVPEQIVTIETSNSPMRILKVFLNS